MARKQEIEINTRLGRRRIDMEKVIYFPRGLAGFEGLHEFTLLQIRPEAPLLLLQSMDKASVGLLVADPFSFMDDYRIKVSDAEQKLLRLKNVRQVAVLVTVSIPAGKPHETVLNLTGPILVNHQARIGLQIPQSEGQSPTQMKLHGLTGRAGKAQMEEQAARERDAQDTRECDVPDAGECDVPDAGECDTREHNAQDASDTRENEAHETLATATAKKAAPKEAPATRLRPRAKKTDPQA